MPTDAWAFAIGRGRRTDYRIIAAPEFLIRNRQFGVLDNVEPPDPARQPQVLHTTTPSGQQLTLACATHVVTRNDLADTAEAHDEQNRPLRLVFGVVVLGCWDLVVNADDLDTAHVAALGAYRRFLANEDDAPVTPSHAFTLRSELTAQASGAIVPLPTLKAFAAFVFTLVVLLIIWLWLDGTSCPNTAPVEPDSTTTSTDDCR